jgi:hypothetical protein
VARVGTGLQAHDPVPEHPRARLPCPVRGPLPARRGRRGDRDPGQPPVRGRPGPPRDVRAGCRPAGPLRAPAEEREAGRRHRVRAGRRVGRVLPPHRRPRCDGLRPRRAARRDARYGIPRVPAPQGLGARPGA